MRTSRLIYCLGFFTIIGMVACQDEDSNEDQLPPSTSQLSIRLTDAPGNFDEVNIHLESVRIKIDGQDWLDLPADSGIYNLLDFRNGIDTTIANGSVPSGAVKEVRFVLGDSNSVKVNSIVHDLKVPSGSSSGLKLKVSENLAPQLSYSILVDFDAARSILQTGNGKYILKPVIRVIADGKDGAIIGSLSPVNVSSMLYAIQNQDTLGGAISDSLGSFTINGLDSGSYALVIDPASPYLKDTISNVSVTTGNVTDLGNIILNQ